MQNIARASSRTDEDTDKWAVAPTAVRASSRVERLAKGCVLVPVVVPAEFQPNGFADEQTVELADVRAGSRADGWAEEKAGCWALARALILYKNRGGLTADCGKWNWRVASGLCRVCRALPHATQSLQCGQNGGRFRNSRWRPSLRLATTERRAMRDGGT